MPLKYASPSGPCCWRPTIEDASLPGWEGIPGTSTNLRKYTLAYERHLFLLINNWTSESGSRMNPKLRRTWTQRISIVLAFICLKKPYVPHNNKFWKLAAFTQTQVDFQLRHENWDLPQGITSRNIRIQACPLWKVHVCLVWKWKRCPLKTTYVTAKERCAQEL